MLAGRRQDSPSFRWFLELAKVVKKFQIEGSSPVDVHKPDFCYTRQICLMLSACAGLARSRPRRGPCQGRQLYGDLGRQRKGCSTSSIVMRRAEMT